MWVFTQGGLLSAVQHEHDPDILVVRARREEHLQHHFPLHKVFHTPTSDYHYRVMTTKEQFATVLAAAAMQIDYTNFKDSVSDELYPIYSNVWAAGLRLNKTKVWDL
jgi:hypothetical protein